jgi:hypothetical protein
MDMEKEKNIASKSHSLVFVRIVKLLKPQKCARIVYLFSAELVLIHMMHTTKLSQLKANCT